MLKGDSFINICIQQLSHIGILRQMTIYIYEKEIRFRLLIMYWLNVILFFVLNTFCADVYLLKTDSCFTSFEDFKTCRLNKMQLLLFHSRDMIIELLTVNANTYSSVNTIN